MFSMLQRWMPCLNPSISPRNIGCANVYIIKDQLYTIYQETEFVLNSKTRQHSSRRRTPTFGGHTKCVGVAPGRS